MAVDTITSQDSCEIQLFLVVATVLNFKDNADSSLRNTLIVIATISL